MKLATHVTLQICLLVTANASLSQNQRLQCVLPALMHGEILLSATEE